MQNDGEKESEKIDDIESGKDVEEETEKDDEQERVDNIEISISDCERR